MAETMRAVDVKNGAGPISALFINGDTPKPKPTAKQALVKIKCFGLNRMDLLQREGHYPVPAGAPKTLGVEFSGTIESFGSSEHERGFSVGDEVFGLAYGGAYAEYIAVSTHMLIRKPKELSWEVCAGIPETWITATQALYLIGGFTPGKSVLWHAGASSVSISGIQLSVGDGASAVYATARQEAKCEFVVNKLGATAAFNANGRWQDEVLKATGGKGVDIIVDFVGAAYFAANLEAVARDGRIVNLGSLGPTTDPGGANFGNFVAKRIRLEGSGLRSRDEEYQGRLRDMLVEHALPKFIDGSFTVHVERVFDWADIQDAHRTMEENRTMGKLICRIS